MDSAIKAVVEDLEARGEPTPDRDAYLERVLPGVRDYLDRQR